MRHSLYHMCVRTMALVCALVLVFDSGLLTPISRSISDSTFTYLANSVGVYAGVESTELSDVTAQLQKREQALTDREQALERQIAARNFGTSEQEDYSTYVLSAILFILIVLIVLNYALDWSRFKQIQYARTNS